MAERRRSQKCERVIASTSQDLGRIAKTKGWTVEQLRTSYDLPKKNLKPGTAIVRIPADLLDDPFKNKQQMNPQEEYDALETRFYNNLSRVVINGKMVAAGRGTTLTTTTSRTVTTTTNRTNHVRVQIAGAQPSNVRLHVEKESIDAVVKLGGGQRK